MPYSSNADLPAGVKVLPAHAQSIYRNAYNSAAKSGKYGDDEGRLASIAWGAVKNAGYAKGKDGKWHKTEKMFDKVLWKREHQRYTLGVVYEPEVPDADGDYATAEDIEKACWAFSRRLQGHTAYTKMAHQVLEHILKALDTGEALQVDVTELAERVEKGIGLNDMHTPDQAHIGEIVENYLCPVDMTLMNGEQVKKGAWLMGVVWTPEYFGKILSGERTGLSMEGWGIREDG